MKKIIITVLVVAVAIGGIVWTLQSNKKENQSKIDIVSKGTGAVPVKVMTKCVLNWAMVEFYPLQQKQKEAVSNAIILMRIGIVKVDPKLFTVKTRTRLI